MLNGAFDENNVYDCENMRLSALQENGYGVGLPQDRIPSDTNEVVMDDSEDIEFTNYNFIEDRPLVSGLPLLFVDGCPTSLEDFTLAQLERFITFMVQCSLGDNTSETITQPQWWPKEVKFSNPLMRPAQANDNWKAKLKKLVFRCYTYHRSEHILRFCSYIAQCPREELEYVDNWDSTTSLYHRSSGKLLVTFRTENMSYDRRNKSPRRKLLSRKGVAPGYPNKIKQQQQSLVMVEPPTEDIYLCDNCDAEFVGFQKMKEHEQTCYEPEHNSNSRPASPDLSTTVPEIRQENFFEYFHLCSTRSESKPIATNTAYTADINVTKRTSRRVRGTLNLTRCPTIPFSSPAGIMLAKKSKAMTEDTQQERLERIERHLIAPVLSSSCRPKWLDAEVDRDRWIVTHKPSRDKPVDDYVHEYKFVNSVKRKPTLSIQSQLLYVVCRPVHVLLTRLNKEHVSKLKRDQIKYRAIRRNSAVDKDMECIRRDEETGRIGPWKRKIVEVENESSTGKKKENATASTGALTIHRVETNSSKITALPSITAPKETTRKPIDTNTNASVHRNTNKITNSIMLIDLCSSDEEDLTPASSDENRDPMNYVESDVKKSVLGKFVPNKICSTPRIFPADTTSDWLSDNILNEDSENCTNNYRNTVMLNTCTNLSPILRPAP